MNIYAKFAAELLELIKDAPFMLDWIQKPGQLSLDQIIVEPPRDASHGDIATNAAMVLAKVLKRRPRDIAVDIVDHLNMHQQRFGISKIDIAGPGFINITFHAYVWLQVLSEILRHPQRFGQPNLGGGAPINIEYVSANPTGPMHVGHCRGAVYGDALARLLDFAGYSVTKEYYVNDAGTQVDLLAQSVFLRYREVLGEHIGEIPEGLYPGQYLVPVAEKLKELHGDALLHMAEGEWHPIVKNMAIEAMMERIHADLAMLGVYHDVFFSERSLITEQHDRVAEMIADLRAKGLIYTGRLAPPKGKKPQDWEDRAQTLFRSTQFGDDVDRALLKSDGSYTYFAFDIAYHYDKFKRGFNNMIDVLGADHSGYMKRMTAAVNAFSDEQAKLDIRFCQLVNLFRDGQPVKMSKRADNFVTLNEVVAEVGPDVTRFMMLYRKNDAKLDFDFASVMEQSRENPVFYVQYAHARTHSIIQNAIAQYGELIISDLQSAELSLLEDSSELDLLKKLAEYPRIVESAALHYEPHRIAFYLAELAAQFHAHWNKGKDSPYLRFIIINDAKLTKARLAFVMAVQTVLKSGLGLLGVEAKQELR